MKDIVGGGAASVNARRWPIRWPWQPAIRSWRPSDLEPVVRLWNASRPRHPMTTARFEHQVCRSPWFDPSGCLVATASPAVTGFLLISERQAVNDTSGARRAGFIECLVLDQACAATVGTALASEALASGRRHGFSALQAAGLRVPCDAEGNVLFPREITCLQRAGFRVGQIGQELAMDSGDWDSTITIRGKNRLRDEGIEIRVATPEDRAHLGAGLQRWHGSDNPQCLGFQRGEPLETFVVACRGAVVVGYCRWALVDGTTPYDRYGSLWVATTSPGTGHVYNLYVDAGHRSRGIGAALVASAFDLLSERGGRGLQGWTALPASQTRYQRWGFRPVGGVVFLSRRLR